MKQNGFDEMYHLKYDDLAVIIPDFEQWVKQYLLLNWIELADGTLHRFNYENMKPIAASCLEVEFASNYKILEANFVKMKVRDLWTNKDEVMTKSAFITSMMTRVRDESYFLREIILKYY